MRRFMVALAAMSLMAVAACSSGSRGSSAAVAKAGPVHVHLFCDDARGQGIGARINPWRVHTKSATQVIFDINVAPGAATVTGTLDPIPGKPWAFQDPSYPVNNDTITAQIAAGAADTTYYRLTMICHINTQTDTIVIDPIVIVD